MPVVVHVPHHGAPGDTPAGGQGVEPQRGWRPGYLAAGLAIAGLIVLLVIGFWASRPHTVAADSDVESQLQALRQRRDARSGRGTDGSAADVANRIRGGASGRAAQQEMLNQSEESRTSPSD